MDIKELQSKLNIYKTGPVERPAWMGKIQFPTRYENEYLIVDYYESFNAPGTAGAVAKMWSIIFYPKKDFQFLNTYYNLCQFTRSKITRLRDDEQGRFAIRFYDMRKNPTNEIILDILNYIFQNSEGRTNIEQEKNDLLATIKKNYTAVRTMKIENSQAFAVNIRSSLEFSVKLFWQEKLGRIPVWINSNGREDFNLNESIKDSRFSSCFERWTITYMHLIRQDCNDIIHGQKELTISTAKELIENLEKCIKAIEKLLDYSIITIIQEEVISPSKPVSTPVVEKKPREKVKHSRFGEGEIVSIKSDIIKVIFGVTIKEFPYPSSINNGTLTYIRNSVIQPTVSAPKKQATTSSQKHRWTYDEDKTCCRVFIETYITHPTYCPFDSIATKILAIYPNMKFSSIKMKLQNIKRICLDYGIKDSSTISPLDNYSNQNLQAMREELLAIGIII